MVSIGPDMGLKGPDMGPKGQYIGPKTLEKNKKPYTDFVFPEQIPKHEWNRNAV